MSSALLSTKLFLPPARPNRVPRPRLVARLDNHKPLTLIAAPAGFGKTSLLAEWIHQGGQRVAWLSLDADDNDPARFFTYLIAALQSCQPELGEGALALLQSQPPAPLKAVVAALVNDLAAPAEPQALVLDDYHVIEAQPIHAALAYLLDHQPPGLRLILATRADPLDLPLARLRARDQLAEIRADGLRFTPDEAAQFLNQVMGLDLSAVDVAALEARTEGWAAGLQLAALSMRGRDDAGSFVEAFSGSHRHVLDYLVEEVLNRQPADMQAFLLRTSIVEQLCAPLCAVLLETEAAQSQTHLERLERANLFLFPLDDEGRWYRYHPLFADALRARLKQWQPGLVAGLHGRASAWHEQAGHVGDAVRHALAAGDGERAAALVEQHAWPLFDHSDVPGVRAWVDQLPDQLVRSRPWLVVIRGAALAATGQVAVAEQLLADTAALFAGPDLPGDLAGELANLRATLARLRQDTAQTIQFARQALAVLPGNRLGSRFGAQINLSLAYMMDGDTQAASREFVTMRAMGEAISSTAALGAMVGLGWYQTRQGLLTQAAQTYQDIIQGVTRLERRIPASFGMAFTGLGEVLYERNQLSEAVAALTRGIELLGGSIEQTILALAWGALAQAYWASGDEARALATLEQADGWLARMGLSDLGYMNIVAMHRAQLSLRRGNLESAAGWAEASGLNAETTLIPHRAAEQMVIARVLIARGQPGRALELLSQMLALAEKWQWAYSVIKCLLLRAVAALGLGQQTEALQALEQALVLAEPENYVRSFVDEGEPIRGLLQRMKPEGGRMNPYVDRLLAAFGSPPSGAAAPTSPTKPAVQSLVEPLSGRELEVLRLIADGLNNSEIAQRLTVSVATVKTHVNHLFRKLEVTSRTQAVARSRALGLLAG